jgi:hypothetical protein
MGIALLTIYIYIYIVYTYKIDIYIYTLVSVLAILSHCLYVVDTILYQFVTFFQY